MYRLIRFFLFLFPAETAHNISFILIKILFKIPFASKITRYLFNISDSSLEREIFGLKFKNPVGLAAGFDKNAILIDELSNFGFGFIEIGTVTPKPQEGNPKPRLFRLVDDNAVINRMGFNNAGVEEIVNKLRKRKSDIIIGGNIGKNKTTPNASAIDDYEVTFNSLFDYVDYFVVNVSSPNTPGLRELQEKKPLKELLNSLQVINSDKSRRKPILLKIAPDLTNSQLDDIIEIVNETKIDGIIATNTTINRENLNSSNSKVNVIGPGGLSGMPLKDRSNDVIRYISSNSNNSIPIIGVGGVFSAEDAIEKIKAGATLVQIYTSFVYKGPQIIKEINKAILENENH